MSPADVIRQLLLDLDLGTDEGDWTVFVSFLPDVPDIALCVYDTSGKMDGRIMKTGEQIEHPGIQIMVRGTDHPTTWQKAKDITDSLDQVRRSLVALDSESSYILHNVSRSGAIVPLGVETEGSKRRHLFSINATVTIEVAS